MKPICWTALQLRRLLPILFLTMTVQNLNSSSIIAVEQFFFNHSLCMKFWCSPVQLMGRYNSRAKLTLCCQSSSWTCKLWDMRLARHGLLFGFWYIYVCSQSKDLPLYQSWCECCQSRVLCHLLWLSDLMQNRSSCKTLPSSATWCTLQHRQSKWFCLTPFAEFGAYRTVSFSVLQAMSPTLLLWTRSSSSCSSSTSSTMVLKSSVVQFWLWLVTPLPVCCNSPRPGLSAGLVCFIWCFVVLLFYLWLDLFVLSSDLACFCQCQIVWVGVCLSISCPSTPPLIYHTLDLQQRVCCLSWMFTGRWLHCKATACWMLSQKNSN